MQFEGFRIKTARINRNRQGGERKQGDAELSLRQFSKLSGISVGALWNYESGVTNPSAERLGKMASILGVCVSDFYRKEG